MTAHEHSLIDLDAIEARANAATPHPWFYNSYSGVFTADHEVQSAYDAEDSPDYPDTPRPGPPWFSDADNAWLKQRHDAYEIDVRVCHVPPEYGDTATGRHAADAEFIAHAREDIPALIAEIRRLHALLHVPTPAELGYPPFTDDPPWETSP